MFDSSKYRSAFIRWFVAGVLAVTLSFSFSGSAGNSTVGMQAACAAGSCCPYDGAVCVVHGEHYQDKDWNNGSCGGDDGWDIWFLSD